VRNLLGLKRWGEKMSRLKIQKIKGIRWKRK